MPGPRLKRASTSLIAAALILLGSALALPRSQEPVSIKPRRLAVRSHGIRSDIRLDVNLVFVPVTVTDPWDHPITNLNAASFRLFEDNVEQTIATVFKEDGPVSVGLLLDTSSSMRKRIDRSIEALGTFLETAQAGDEFFLVRFADSPKLVTGFTRNPQDIIRGLPGSQTQGWTALLDAISLGVHEMKKAKNPRRALLVLTDGGDNDSRYTESEIRDLVMESDIRLYAIGINEQYHFLEKLAAQSGGMSYFARKLDDLPAVIDRLSKDLREQYVLGYSSNNTRKDGKFRSLKVELIPPAHDRQWNVVWRRGYYAPPE